MFVTVTLAGPTGLAEDVQLICELLSTTTLVAATPPTETEALETKFVPVKYIVVPPFVLPLGGITDVKVGAGRATVV